MKLHPRGEPLLDETMELPTLSVTPGPPHPRGGRGSFSSSYSSGFAGTDSLCSFNSSQLFDDSDSQEVDVDDLDSSSSRGDYALLSMPVESAKRMVPTTGVVTRPSSRVMDASWNSQISSVRSTAAIADALRELREGRVAVEQVLAVEDEERRLEDNETKVTSVSLNKLVTRLSTHRDLFVLSMGLLAATIHGGLWSLLARQVNAAIAAFVPYDRHDVDAAALALMLLSLALGVTAYAAHLCLSHTAERLLRALREQVLRHLLLDLNQPWFDANKDTASGLGAQLTREAETIRQGLGPELGAVCRFTTQFVGGFLVAFMTLWDLTLAVTCVAPVAVTVIAALSHDAATSENEADVVVAEVLSNLQTLLALNAQRRVREKHALRVRITERERVVQHGKKAALQGALTGSLWVMSAIGLWYGGKKVYEAEAQPNEVFETLLGVVVGSHALGHLLPSFAAVFRAKRAASKLFELLEIPSSSKNHSQNDVMNPLPRPETFSGALMAVDLHFAYPTRPQRQVLRGCNVSAMTGECVAVVGGAGAGKSTLLTLLYADKIVVLEAGKAVEQGTHVELLQRRNSFYRRLHLIQRTASSLCPSGAAPLRLQYQRRVVHAAPTSPTKLTERDVKALARPERTVLMVGLAASVLVGLAAPLLGVLISEMLADMVQQYTRFLASRDAQALVNTLRPLVMRHGFFLSAGAAVVVVFQSMQLFCLDAAAERVASQLRDLHFSSLLAQPVSFFDAPQHAPKLLADSLATQASTASLVVGRAQGYKLQIAVALVASLAVAFWRGSWMLTLVLLAALPLLLIGESIRAQYTLKTRSIPDRTESEEAVDVHVSEALRNRPTVVMLGLETSWCSSFDVLLQRPLRYTRHKAQLDAVARGFSGVVMVAACALTCWLSGVLVHSGDATFRELD
ncbi:ATP-dependent translocase ABCB1 [Phytophthora ramorum]|uniref:ATP-dependent translocase ABCB1 n=1 Tax=Phytophthora ramorum TaxID=164328 RepID=UPI0030AB06C2|nr:ATP-dependent translocase ABCB1 [Phytophthora ramorum]